MTVLKKSFRIMLPVSGVLFTLWLCGLFWFAAQINRVPQNAEVTTDAIVALTGGSMRVAAAVELLKQNKAEKLFISGVNEKVDWIALAETIHELPEELGDRITLGHVACNTLENALETKEWLERNGFKSVRLVTASYHMPRSLSEFRGVLNGVDIVPNPVFPQTVKHDEWWKWRGTLVLIASEYMKFLVAAIRRALPFARPVLNNTVCP